MSRLFFTASLPRLEVGNILLIRIVVITMRWVLPVAIILIVIGIIGLGAVNFYVFEPNEPGIVRPPSRGPGGPFRGPATAEFSSNGEQIYFTGTSSKGVVTATGGPFWFQMHDGGCVVCHGPAGRGGEVFMMGTRFTAPNITYKTLTGEGRGAEGEEEHRPYTDALIKRAITRGLNPDGEQLSDNMPRWQMSDEELDDIIAYLKVLDP